MFHSLRSKILIIVTLAVVVSLSLSAAVVFTLVRQGTLETIEENLAAVTDASALAINKWASAKAQSVQAVADAVEPGDPRGLLKQMTVASGFPVATVGWEDKKFISISPTPSAPDYDPTARPWYKASVAAGKPVITKPYADAGTGEAQVSFTSPILRSGKTEGVVAGAVQLKGIADVIQGIHPTPASFGVLMSSSGQILSYRERELLLKEALALSPQLTPELVAELPKARRPVEVMVGNAAKLVKATRIEGTDWMLVVALDRSDAMAGLYRLIWTLLGAMVLLVVAATTLCAWFTSASFRALLVVRDAMEDIGSGGGDLTQRLPVHGRDEVAQISASFNAFSSKLGTVMQAITEAVKSVNIATSEIEAGNHDLSSRTETSASHLQRTAGSLSELSARLRHSAEAIGQVTSLSQTANQAATTGKQVVDDAINTMDEIARSSSKIVDIIGVIDGIAFQTNILALNAAVEAARAGEHGRGFAVVASEVRALASRSANSAKEIKSLIARSEESVHSGTERVRAAGMSMDTIVGNIQSVSRLIVDVNASIAQQNAEVQQIHGVLSNMEQTTQQNAALVEESAAAASMLNKQAHDLAAQVGVFKLS